MQIQSHQEGNDNIQVTALQREPDPIIDIYEKAICSQGKTCKQICVSKECKKYVVVCGDKRCKCQEDHREPKLCSLMPPQFLLRQLQKKHSGSPTLKKYILDSFEKLIDWLSEERDKIQTQVRLCGMTDQGRKFIELSKKHQFKKLTGQMTGHVLEELNQDNNDFEESRSNKLQRQLEKQWERILGPIKEQVRTLEKVVNSFLGKSVNTAPVVKPFTDSKILKTEEQRETLVQFFPEAQRDFSSKLLYRASQNQFLVDLFHDKCFGIENTVTVVKTEFNKIIGGYTPLAWKGKQEEDGYGEQDKYKQTFLFSVSNKDKLTIAPGSKEQIWHRKSQGPVFVNGKGWKDLFINNAANSNYKSCASVGNGYENPNYKAREPKSFEMFSGQTNGSSSFKILEWQVYQLTF